MEATLLFSPQFLPARPPNFPGLKSWGRNGRLNYPRSGEACLSLKTDGLYGNRPPWLRGCKRFCANLSDRIRDENVNADGTPNIGAVPEEADGGSALVGGSDNLMMHRGMFKNRFLDLVRLSSVLNNAADSFFKSEMRRRVFVTAVLLVVSRLGYHVPLPGFDRRLIPRDYLNHVPGSMKDLGDFSSGLKLSFFQLGIGPLIFSSIAMHGLCNIVPSLIKLRKEGLDAHEKIKSYIWWMSLGFAIVEAVTIAFNSRQYSFYATGYRAKHVLLTSFLLVCGAMTMTWICDTISKSGFGQGSSLIICLGILKGYTEALCKMYIQLSGSAVTWWPYVLGGLGMFIMVTMWAIIVTEGCRKIKLQYYGFKLASAERDGSPFNEVEPYIPFNINPSGMQPVLTATYLLALPTIIASIVGSNFWELVKKIPNPNSTGADRWVYYSIYAFLVFLFNMFDIANLPVEISDYLNKMGARIPNVKPGKATIEYLTKIQASTRFWGGLLLSILATTSIMLDHYLRQINEVYSIGFTSVLIIVSACLLMDLEHLYYIRLSIIHEYTRMRLGVREPYDRTSESKVGSIIELRRSYIAYNVMPSLSKALRRYGVQTS